uniref:Mitogen-activated protein kinase 15 n=1 Tax=Spermophilus dauricus TaxID=99837 RepID=A0A8C9Q0W2_SPEDA
SEHSPQAYGIVWKAVDQRTGEVVAIKKIFDAFRDKTDAQRTFREIMLLREFGDHPNIIRLLDVIPAENDRDIYLVFEFMDTDLNAVIRKGSVLEDTHKRFVFYQLLQATRFLHSGHVIHRDQKPSNVLLDANCRVKLCDFGLARSLSNLPEGPEGGALTEYVATRWYRAPEVLLSSPWYTLGVDMWSLGCILGEMLRGQPLFPGTSTVHQLELILETIPLPTEEDLRALGAGYSCTLLHLLGSRPQQSLDDILPPDTPRDALDLLRKLLVFAPSKRLSAAQALQHPYVRRFHCPSREWTHDSEVPSRCRLRRVSLGGSTGHPEAEGQRVQLWGDSARPARTVQGRGSGVGALGRLERAGTGARVGRLQMAKEAGLATGPSGNAKGPAGWGQGPHPDEGYGVQGSAPPCRVQHGHRAKRGRGCREKRGGCCRGEAVAGGITPRTQGRACLLPDLCSAGERPQGLVQEAVTGLGCEGAGQVYLWAPISSEGAHGGTCLAFGGVEPHQMSEALKEAAVLGIRRDGWPQKAPSPTLPDPGSRVGGGQPGWAGVAGGGLALGPAS